MAYEFFTSAVSPRHMAIAASMMGVKEVPGKGSNPTIMKWVKELGLEKIYLDDDQAWCAIAWQYAMFKAGRRITLETKDQYDYLRALQFQNTQDLRKIPVGLAAFGDTLIFKRPEGGHIGFYIGEDKDNFYVWGGNQGNKVSVVKIAKARCVCVLRPDYISFSPQKYTLNESGDISHNEA